MKRYASLVLILTIPLWAAEERTKNVILFIGDAGGLPILSAAAAYKGRPQSLFIERTVKTSKGDTLVIFTADHSFDTRLKGGRKGEALLPAENTPPAAKPNIRVDGGHTGEEVLVAAQGPGAERVKGFFPNTHLFQVMMTAYGWNAGHR